MDRNEENNPVKKTFKYHLIKNFINLFFVLFTAIAVASSNSISLTILNYIPLLIIPTLIYNFAEWRLIRQNRKYSNSSLWKVHLLISIFSSVFFCVFLGVFYGVFQPLFSIPFEPIDKCQVVGVMPMNQPSYERYTILYVDYEYENQKFLGYACMSDSVYITGQPQFVNQGEFIPCDDVDPSYFLPEGLNSKKRVLDYSLKNRKRVLRDRGVCENVGKSAASRYNFSKVKLSTWMCLSDSTLYEELVREKRCYLHFYKDFQKSYQNSKNRLPLKDTNNFALIVFEQPFYYPETAFICLIVFSFLPFLLNYYPISMIITSILFKKLKKEKSMFQVL